MKSLFLFLIATLTFSCKNEMLDNTDNFNPNNEFSQIKSLSVDIYNENEFPHSEFFAFFAPESKYKDTLIIGYCTHKADKQGDSCTYNHISLKQQEKETLYYLFLNAKNNFKFVDTQIKKADNKSVRISVKSNISLITCNYKGLQNAKSVNPEIGKLLSYINSKLDKNLKLQ